MKEAEVDSWAENGGLVTCWMSGRKEALIILSINLMRDGYFCVLSQRKYKDLGIFHILRAAKIATFIVPHLVLERNQLEGMKQRQDYSLDKSLLLSPDENKWKAETRLWITTEEDNPEIRHKANAVRFLSAMYLGTFTH